MYMKKKILRCCAAIIGAMFLLFAYVYWTTPANALPAYMPGADMSSSVVHFKHGLASLILGIAFFVYAWFQTGKKK